MLYGLYQRLNVSVAASDEEVIEALHGKLKPEAFMPENSAALAEWEDAILTEHRRARALFEEVMS